MTRTQYTDGDVHDKEAVWHQVAAPGWLAHQAGLLAKSMYSFSYGTFCTQHTTHRSTCQGVECNILSTSSIKWLPDMLFGCDLSPTSLALCLKFGVHNARGCSKLRPAVQAVILAITTHQGHRMLLLIAVCCCCAHALQVLKVHMCTPWPPE